MNTKYISHMCFLTSPCAKPTHVGTVVSLKNRQLKPVCGAGLKEKWGKKHPIVIKSWENNWQELTTYFSYPYGIRRLIYTTNTVEAYHRQLRKVTKTKTSFPTDDSLRKIIYLAIRDITKKWTMPLQNWAECISQFVIQFEGRLNVF